MIIKNVTVIGAGMMGNALAMVFAMSPDLNVTLRTRTLKDDRYDPIIALLDIMVSRDVITGVQKEEVLSILN